MCNSVTKLNTKNEPTRRKKYLKNVSYHEDNQALE